MPEKKFPKTQFLALKYLAEHNETDYSNLREASKSGGSPKYIAEILRKKGFATIVDGKIYRITERGLGELKKIMSYERELWEF